MGALAHCAALILTFILLPCVTNQDILEVRHNSTHSSGLDLLILVYNTTTINMAANMDYYKEQVVKKLYEKNKYTDILAQIESKTQVKREYLASGVFVFIGLYLVFGYGCQLICNAIGFVYPAYCSIKALETDSKEDDTRWLTYWVVFAFFSLTEFFSDFFLSWFPLYWLAKCIFLVWCYLPLSWNGSDMIYSHIIRPNFLKNQTEIDKAMDKVSHEIEEMVGNVTHLASNK